MQELPSDQDEDDFAEHVDVAQGVVVPSAEFDNDEQDDPIGENLKKRMKQNDMIRASPSASSKIDDTVFSFKPVNSPFLQQHKDAFAEWIKEPMLEPKRLQGNVATSNRLKESSNYKRQQDLKELENRTSLS